MRRFVNKIADYVHQAANDNFGSANKNIGEAFLMTWQLQARNRSGTHSPRRGAAAICSVHARFTAYVLHAGPLTVVLSVQATPQAARRRLGFA